MWTTWMKILVEVVAGLRNPFEGGIGESEFGYAH